MIITGENYVPPSWDRRPYRDRAVSEPDPDTSCEIRKYMDRLRAEIIDEQPGLRNRYLAVVRYPDGGKDGWVEILVGSETEAFRAAKSRARQIGREGENVCYGVGPLANYSPIAVASVQGSGRRRSADSRRNGRVKSQAARWLPPEFDGYF